MPHRRCPECGRDIPIEKKRWVRHYLQDKHWGDENGERTLCDNSGELANIARRDDDDHLTEADYQTWMRL